MIVISNSSPLIALARINRLTVFQALFGQIYIPNTVYQETVLQSNVSVQRENILQAINTFIVVETPTTDHPFRRTIDFGEQGVLNLAFDKQADLLIIDEKKARNEAKELGFRVVNTATLLKRAENLGIIISYHDVLTELEMLRIYLPH